MTARLILGCLLVTMMAGCSKCGGSKAKDEYIAKLDARCLELQKQAEEMNKNLLAAQAKEDYATVAAETERAMTLRQSLSEELKQIPQPADNAADLQAFWTENDALGAAYPRYIEAVRNYAEVKKQGGAPAEGAEEPKEDEEAPAAQPEANAEAEQAAVANVQQIQQEMAGQAAKLDAAARKYGFKVCGHLPAAAKQ